MSARTLQERSAARWVIAQIPLLALTIALPVAQVLLRLQGPWLTVFQLPTRVLGVALTGLAIYLFRSAERELGPNLVASPLPAPRATLRDTGMYAIVRHPIYVAILVGLIGWAVAWLSVMCLGLGLACGVFFLAKSRYEEKLLCETFPGYEGYRRRVPGFIPRIRKMVR